jgi:hypothetical protein
MRRIEELEFDEDEPDTYVSAGGQPDLASLEDEADTWPEYEME